MTSRRLCALALVLYVPAWFLPAVRLPGDSFGGGPTLGWEAFMLALSPLFGDASIESLPFRTWMVASALSNVVLAAGLGLIAWRPRAVTRLLVGSLAAATVINTIWFFLPDMRGSLRVGYYLWLAAFAVGTLAAHAARRTTVPRLALSALCLALGTGTLAGQAPTPRLSPQQAQEDFDVLQRPRLEFDSATLTSRPS